MGGGGGLTFGFIHFAVTSPFPTQKMSEPILLNDRHLEETDTIAEVESFDDSKFEVVEAPMNDEEPEQPEESSSVMELLLDVHEDTTENVAGADDNSAEPSKEQKSHEERVQAIAEKCAKKSETTTAARRNRRASACATKGVLLLGRLSLSLQGGLTFGAGSYFRGGGGLLLYPKCLGSTKLSFA